MKQLKFKNRKVSGSKKMRTHILIIILFVFSFFLNAQQQYDNWQFGNSCNLGIPLAGVSPLFVPSAMNSAEQCASWSDPATGALMYYTDGRTIWDNLHVPVIVGLNSSPNNPIGSTSQGVIIIPITPQLHFIYTVSDVGAINNGITQYAINPTNLAGGLIAGLSNINPGENYATTEQLTAVPSCRQGEYWLIVKPVGDVTDYPFLLNSGPGFGGTWDRLLAYRVNALGIQPVPVASLSGPFTTAGINTADYVGTMKFAPNREYFGVAEREFASPAFWFPPANGNVHLYRFNGNTGVFTHQLTWLQNATTYGLSFSPNSNILYAQCGTATIRAYNLEDFFNNGCSPVPVVPGISNFGSGIPIAPLNHHRYYQLQIANDGRIYWPRPNSGDLGCFTNPNSSTVPNPIMPATTLFGGQTCRTGLPNHMDGLNPLLFGFRYCNFGCNEVCFDITNACNNIPTGTITWNFGDGTSVSQPANTGIAGNPTTTGLINSPCHTYSNAVPTVFVVELFINGVFQSSHNVLVSGIDNWQQQTSSVGLSTMQGDKGEDVIIANDNSIYVSGTFTETTRFNDGINPPVVIAANAAGTAYLAKYNSCGELIWVNYDRKGYSAGKSIAIDEKRNMIFMTGSYGGGGGGVANFFTTGWCPSGCATPVLATPISGGNMYIAGFSTTNGAFLESFSSSGPADIVPNSICANISSPTTTELYVCGYRKVNAAPFPDRTFVANFTSSSGSILPGWTYNSLNPTGYVRANDIVYNSVEKKLYVVGDFNNTIQFPTTLMTSATAANEAFILSVFPSGTFGGFLRTGNFGGIGTNVSSAQSVAYDATINRVYVAGTLVGAKTSFFGFGFVVPTTPHLTMPGVKAYVIGFNQVAHPYAMEYKRQIRTTLPASPFEARGTGVAATNNGKVILYGYWLGSSLNGLVSVNNPSGPLPNGGYTSTASFRKLFMAAFDNDMTSTAMWDNTSTSVLSDHHLSSKVAANDNFAIYTGSFKKDLGYTNGIHTNLNGTSAQGNTFLLKGDLNNFNSLRVSQESESAEEEVILDGAISIEVKPNPTTGSLKVILPKGSEQTTYIIELVDIQGKVIFSKMINHTSNELDLSSYNDGLYILNINDGEKITHKKVVKQ